MCTDRHDICQPYANIICYDFALSSISLVIFDYCSPYIVKSSACSVSRVTAVVFTRVLPWVSDTSDVTRPVGSLWIAPHSKCGPPLRRFKHDPILIINFPCYFNGHSTVQPLLLDCNDTNSKRHQLAKRKSPQVGKLATFSPFNVYRRQFISAFMLVVFKWRDSSLN